MKKLIILTTCLILFYPATSSGKNNIKNAKQLHSQDTTISNTLNVLKTIKVNESQPQTYNPMNLHFEQPKISIKDRKARKKSLFLKERRTRKLQRKVKKLNFYMQRRQSKFVKNPYLLTWIHKLNSKGEI